VKVPEPAPERPPETAPAPVARTKPEQRRHVVDVRNYRRATGKPEDAGTPLVVLLLVTTTPAVLAAALLRPPLTVRRRARPCLIHTLAALPAPHSENLMSEWLVLAAAMAAACAVVLVITLLRQYRLNKAGAAEDDDAPGTPTSSNT
jgi:hypothetical protein